MIGEASRLVMAVSVATLVAGTRAAAAPGRFLVLCQDAAALRARIYRIEGSRVTAGRGGTVLKYTYDDRNNRTGDAALSPTGRWLAVNLHTDSGDLLVIVDMKTLRAVDRIASGHTFGREFKWLSPNTLLRWTGPVASDRGVPPYNTIRVCAPNWSRGVDWVTAEKVPEPERDMTRFDRAGAILDRLRMRQIPSPESFGLTPWRDILLNGGGCVSADGSMVAVRSWDYDQDRDRVVIVRRSTGWKAEKLDVPEWSRPVTFWRSKLIVQESRLDDEPVPAHMGRRLRATNLLLIDPNGRAPRARLRGEAFVPLPANRRR